MDESKYAELPPMDWGMAAVQTIIATLVVLQRSGALQIADVVSELGNTIDFRAQHFPEQKAKEAVLKHVYDMIAVAERHETELAAAKARRDAAGRGNLPPKN